MAGQENSSDSLRLDISKLAGTLMRIEYDARRVATYGWFAAFFFNSHQRRRVLERWDDLCDCVAFAEQMTLARTTPAELPATVDADRIEDVFRQLRSSPDFPMLSETVLLKPEGLSFGTEEFRQKLLKRYLDSGIAIQTGLDMLADTLPTECSFAQSQILMHADEREQARFFFGHLRPLGFATVRALGLLSDSPDLAAVTQLLRRFLVTEEALFKSGYDGNPAAGRTLN